MPSEVLLIAIATLGVTLAGFAGVVAVFREDDTWTDVHSFRLRVLVRNSLAVMFMSLLPLVFFAGFGDERAAIGAASVAFGGWFSVVRPRTHRRGTATDPLVHALDTSWIAPMRQYVRLFRSLVLFAEQELP